MIISWKAYEATRAFERSRSRAFVRRMLSWIRGTRRGTRYSAYSPTEDCLVDIDDIELLDVEGSLIRLPALPKTQIGAWIKDYAACALSDPDRKPFSTRLEQGRLVLEGGIPELRRLELCRTFGETRVEARMSTPVRPALDIIECRDTPREPCRTDKAAS